MNQDNLKHKFSLGLSLEMQITEYEKLIDDFFPYIGSFYFSPPLGKRYHTRSKIADQFQEPELCKRFYEIVHLVQKRGIMLDCVLNRPSIRPDEMQEALNYIKQEMDVELITCLEEYGEHVRRQFPKKEIIYSYNNDLTREKITKIPKAFDTVVVGKYFLRCPGLLEKIYKRGFGIELLVNNGCSYNCGGCRCGNLQCDQTVIRNLKDKDVNYLYALQSFYPYELHELLEGLSISIKCIKISNRTSGYRYLKNCLQSYVENRNPEEYVIEDYRNYRLWSRLGELSKHLKELDNDAINRYKREIHVSYL